MCCELGFAIGQTPFEKGVVLLNGDIEDMCCSTGDNFVNDITKEEVISDVVDMEAYAIAKACKQADVNFRCFKYISDSADENANDDWAKTVADGEEHYIKIFQQIVGGF
jgi:adenosylhomocysteine nucleosidase